MKPFLTLAALALMASSATTPAAAQSFSCMNADELSPTERKICASRWLGNLDERLAFWYDRAMTRARYFDQTGEVRRAQKNWLSDRNACGARFWCIRGAYTRRIRELRDYAEHV